VSNLLGKCKEQGCDYVIFATSEDVQEAEGFRDVTAGTGVYHVGNYGHFARCDKRHKVFPCKAVKGTYSADHQCDSRCLNAKGWSCTCSCGGANHGRGHVATIVQASSLPEGEVKGPATRVTPEPKHLGEVGKHIRGKVRVVRASALSKYNKTLYTFETEGGDFIKWFCPDYADPEWEPSAEFSRTIRAKVKAHDDQPCACTIVTYVEEVQ
jgi:hypothetical protein